MRCSFVRCSFVGCSFVRCSFVTRWSALQSGGSPHRRAVSWAPFASVLGRPDDFSDASASSNFFTPSRSFIRYLLLALVSSIIRSRQSFSKLLPRRTCPRYRSFICLIVVSKDLDVLAICKTCWLVLLAVHGILSILCSSHIPGTFSPLLI